jgi:hypothetical protein
MQVDALHILFIAQTFALSQAPQRKITLLGIQIFRILDYTFFNIGVCITAKRNTDWYKATLG